MMKNIKKSEEESLNCKKRKMVIIVAAVIVLGFGAYILFWYMWQNAKYTPYITGMEEFVPGKSYVYTAEDGYLYNVKKPDFLTYTGNMCVSVPKGECALLIWPKSRKGFDYGVQIQKDQEIYSIMLKADHTAVEKNDNELLQEYSECIEDLFKKASDKWEI